MERLNLLSGQVKASSTAWHRVNIEKTIFPNVGDLKGKTLFITGASRGIGLAIALRAAQDGANIVVAAKTDKPHPKLEGTIHTAAQDIEKAGGKALAVVCDIRDEKSVQNAIDQAVSKFGGIDIVVNNASAISPTGTLDTSMKTYDLMHSINTRGTFLVTKLAIPHLKKSANPHVLTISPPLDIFNTGKNWFSQTPAYTIAKYGMTLMAYGHAEELKEMGIAVNTLWPRTYIATAAVKNLLGGDESLKRARKPEIMGDAAWHIITSDAKVITGNYFMDDQVHISISPYQDLDAMYNCVEGTKTEDLLPDGFC